METGYDQNVAILRAYPDAKVDLWDQHFVNGKYVIGYELDPSLHQTLQIILPKVRFLVILKKATKWSKKSQFM